VSLNLQNTLVVVLFYIEAFMEPTANCWLAGICCRLCFVITEDVALLCTLTKLVVATAKAGIDASVSIFEVAEALAAEADGEALVLASMVVDALAPTLAGE
jgi:hypothetical protein